VVAPVEHEMKFRVASLEGVRQRLLQLGAALASPRHAEENWILDDAAGRIAARGSLLRLRRCHDKVWLTFKGKATFASGVKSRDEIECCAADADCLLALFARLGFAPVRRYQKRREEWRLGQVLVALDETPMGTFVEIEGAVPALGPAAAALALDPRQAVVGTYLELWEQYRADHPDAPRDMVFA
jgi:adenylate cyclase class 2